MPTFLVTYHNNDSKELDAFSRSDLIQYHFDGDEEKFKSEVSVLRWHHNTVQFTEDVATGKIDKVISTADANPYAWREDHRDIEDKHEPLDPDKEGGKSDK